MSLRDPFTGQIDFDEVDIDEVDFDEVDLVAGLEKAPLQGKGSGRSGSAAWAACGRRGHPR